MTDKELIALVESRLPQELSLEELELIARRMRQSAAVREALAGQLELNEYLATVISPVELSADAVVARAGRRRSLRPGSVWRLLGWTVCLLLIAFTAAMFALPAIRQRNARLAQRTTDAAKPNSATAVQGDPSAAAALDPFNVQKGNAAGDKASDKQGAAAAGKKPGDKTPNAGYPGKQGRDSGSGAKPSDHSTRPAPAAEGPPPLPWQRKNQLAGPPRPWDQVALEFIGVSGLSSTTDTGPSDSPLSVAEVKHWFTPANGNWQVQQRDWQGRRLPFTTGLERFEAPWSDDSVLRLSLCECIPLSIHFWRDHAGLSLRLYSNHWSLAAYRTQRDGRQSVPRNFVTVSTDDGRNWNTSNGTYPLRFDLRFHGGELTVSRGETVLLRAPFEGLPTETYFDGSALFAGLDMVRVSGELPAEPDPLPVLKDIARPADLAWHGPAAPKPLVQNPAAPNQPGQKSAPLPPGIEFNKLADGAVEMKSSGAKAIGSQWFDLPKEGLYEIEMELDHVTPGARVVFGPAGADPIATIGFFQENQTHGMACRLAQLYDRQDIEQQIANDVCSLAAPHQWIRLVGGCGLTRLYGGVDGVHWARFGIGMRDFWSPPLARLGICCEPGDGVHSIVLRRVVLREFHELAQLAPAELLAKAPLVAGDNLQQWKAEIAKHPAPAGASPGDWQRACALRSVVGNAPTLLGRELLAELLGYSLNLPMSVERRLRLVHEIVAISDDWTDGNAATNLVTRFELLGEQLIRQQYATPWTAVDGAVVRSPIWSAGSYSTRMDSLARAELLQLVYSNQPEQVLRTVGRLRLSHFAEPLMLWAEEWASSQTGADLDVDAVAERIGRNPLIDEFNKEGFSTLAEFESALDSQSFHDACQIITSPATLEINGLMPDPRDSQLSVSLDTAVGSALRRQPALRDMMNRQFGPAGMLEVRRAMDQADSAGVLAAATRYRGTLAAAEACLWLGDRAVGGGEFNRARVWYRQAMQSGNASIAQRALPHDRLAAAMLGEDVGSPATEAVPFGEVTMSPSEFESLVAEMRKVHAVNGHPSSAAAAVAALVPPAPAPSGFELHQLERFDGDMGDNPGDPNSATPSRGNSLHWLRPITASDVATEIDAPAINTSLDWVARQLAVASDSERLYVSNRFQVSAYETKNGHRVWRTELGGEHDRTHDWTLVPMRPLPVGQRLFVRRLTRTHPELAALDAAGGAVKWRSLPSLMVVSDPLWMGTEVAAVSAERIDNETAFSLTVFDPADGSVRRSQPIATMHETWWSERTCQLAQAGDNLVVVLCGAVACCDLSGRPRWIRRQEWLSPAEDHDWGRQSQTPPLVAGSKIIVTQPGVMAVECLDLDSGSLVWRTAMPGIHRMIGLAGDRLLAETDYGIAALSVAKGAVLWYHPAADLLDGQLCGGPGQFVYTCRQPAPGNPNQSRPLLVWLNLADGKETARHALDTLRQDHPLLGPFAAAGDHLWVFSAGAENDPNRTIYELLPKGPAIGMNLAPPGDQSQPLARTAAD